MICASSVTIAIVNYNTCDALRECLNSLERIRAEANCTVIVVDNASADGSTRMLEYEFPQVRVIVNSENIGFARAVNAALSAVNTDFVLLLNPDTWVAEHALTRLLETAGADPEIAVVGAQLTSFDGVSQPSVLSPPTLLKEFFNLLPELKAVLIPRVLIRRLHRKREHRVGKLVLVPAVSGGAMLVRTTAFKRVNGMDPRFFVYHEEVDLCLRLRKEGWKIVFEPLAQVLHHDALATGFKTAKLPREPVLTWRLKGVSLLFEKHASMAQQKRFLKMAGFLLRLRAGLARMRGWFPQASSAAWRERADELEIAAVRVAKFGNRPI